MYATIAKTKLYIHQFAPFNFKLIDEIANYYISSHAETCINIFEINNILAYFEHNPYVEAFWAWWPALYPELRQSGVVVVHEG